MTGDIVVRPKFPVDQFLSSLALVSHDASSTFDLYQNDSTGVAAKITLAQPRVSASGVWRLLDFDATAFSSGKWSEQDHLQSTSICVQS